MLRCVSSAALQPLLCFVVDSLCAPQREIDDDGYVVRRTRDEVTQRARYTLIVRERVCTLLSLPGSEKHFFIVSLLPSFFDLSRVP